jgi:hypothetical protein
VLFGGIEGDCTGVLNCPFAVNASRVDETESRGNDIAQRSRSMKSCSTAFCGNASVAICDLDAGRCVASFDAGGQDAPSLVDAGLE